MTASWTLRIAQILATASLAGTSNTSTLSRTQSFPTNSPPASTPTAVPDPVRIPSTTSSPKSNEPTVYTVTVGADGFTYTPNNLTNVAVGDNVIFEFYPADHSVARAEFGNNPCFPYEYTGKDKVGFWSGTQLVQDTRHTKTWNLTINSTEPIFYYCGAPTSCLQHHMIGVINPNGTQTLEMQLAAVDRATLMLQPGQQVPEEQASSYPDAPTASALFGSQSPSNNGKTHVLSGGTVDGIVISAVAFLVVCAALFFYIGRFNSLKESLKRQDKNARLSNMSGYRGSEMQQHHGHRSNPSSPSPYLPASGRSEYMAHSPPMYGQHSATEPFPSGWGSPPIHNGHFSGVSGMLQEELSTVKDVPGQTYPVELHSPQPNAQELPAELEVPRLEK